MTKILITGGAGQLGQAFAAYAHSQAERQGIELAVLTHSLLDITSAASIRKALSHYQPDLVINAAAYTDVERAETEREKAYAVNAEGAALLAKQCAAYGADLIQISTDYVFDGTKGAAYEVGDKVNPLNTYGQSKLAGEVAVLQVYPRAIIIRTAWLYSEFANNFQTKILNAAKTGRALSVVDNQWGTPTEANDLVRFLLYLSGDLRPYRGRIMHFAGTQLMSRWELAKAIVAAAYERGELAALPRIEAAKTDRLRSLAQRPLNSALKNTLLDSDGTQPSGGDQ